MSLKISVNRAGEGAKSPEAGTLGDLGELERLSEAAVFLQEPWRQRSTQGLGRRHIRCGDLAVLECDPEVAAYLVALVNAHRSGKLVASTGSEEKTKGEPLKLSRDEVIRDCVERAKDFWSIVDGAAPVDPQMTVEEARSILRELPPERTPDEWLAWYRDRAEKNKDLVIGGFYALRVRWVQTALRIFHAGGKVR